MPDFKVISLTDAAADRVREITSANANAAGVRIGIKKGGCAGMEYTVDLVTDPDSKDDHINHDGVDVWVAPEAALFLLGTQMDYEVSTLRSGFVFNNPNVESACGCGESVELKPADLKALAEAPRRAIAVPMQDDDIRDMFAGLGPVTIKRMFGGRGIYHGGLIIALEVDGEILLKADQVSAPEFSAAGSRQWHYEGKKAGRPVAMPYWTIPDEAVDDPDQFVKWATKAYEASLRSKK